MSLWLMSKREKSLMYELQQRMSKREAEETIREMREEEGVEFLPDEHVI